MHLTIKFFGETTVQNIPDIDRCLAAASARLQAFGLEIKNTKMFGSRYQPRVIRFGIDDGAIFSNSFSKQRSN